MSELRQVSFPPDVFARIAPDVSLQRHLSIGLRPNLRNFNEFKSINISTGNLNKNENIVGSSILKSVNTTIICTITLGIVENSKSDDILSSQQEHEYSSVYPVVEIARGRSGAPTDEEIILSQKLYETILHSKVIPASSLEIDHGISVIEENDTIKIYYPDLNQEEFKLLNMNSSNKSKSYSFVLYGNLKVFSRSCPLFDLCYLSLVHAIKSIKLPRIYLNDFNPLKIAINSKSMFARRNDRSNENNLNVDSNDSLKYDLVINGEEFGISSNFGVIKLDQTSSLLDDNMELDTKSILLTDLDGECEENSIISKIDIISNEKYLKSISLIGGGANISLDLLKDAIKISKLRAKNFDSNNSIVNNE